MFLLKKIITKIINIIAPEFLSNRYKKKLENNYFKKYAQLKRKHKIIYALTPPPRLSNIGDQAQVVAIYKWLEDFYPSMPIIEVDKDECTSMVQPLKKLVQKNDLIFLHSGGNLGDRGIWSETGRRTIIKNFPENKIVSLPQTIYFSDTKKGKQEKLNSEKIYNKHRNLTVIGRDPESGRIATEMFPKCKTFCIPDFVLYLNANDLLKSRNKAPGGTLFCLRKDNESVLSSEKKEELISAFTPPFEHFDTTIENQIYPEERKNYLIETLKYFDGFETIVTDRYHGLIFAAILQKPTIVLPTVDHKLTSAFEWFKGISNIRFLNIQNLNMVENAKDEVIKAPLTDFFWNQKYFDKLIKEI